MKIKGCNQVSWLYQDEILYCKITKSIINYKVYNKNEFHRLLRLVSCDVRVIILYNKQNVIRSTSIRISLINPLLGLSGKFIVPLIETNAIRRQRIANVMPRNHFILQMTHCIMKDFLPFWSSIE